jgi:hypothetical protein
MKKSIALLAWNNGQASQRCVTALRHTQAARMSRRTLPPSHAAYGMAAPAALHAQPEIAREQRAEMRSGTAVHRCLTEASIIEEDHWQAFPAGQTSVVAWLDLNLGPHPQVKMPGRGSRLPGTYQVDADLASSAEQSRP